MAPRKREPHTERVGSSGHDSHCFIVMPFGRGVEEQRWFRGWYEAVIEPAVTHVGFDPILAATEDQPGAINDEIRSHLVFDPMVVVDLGGRSHSDQPNPNVMYELGIRHAFGRPVVIMAWEDQQLPFDVNNQRAVLSRRDFLDIESTRQKLARFIDAASTGKFYNPMQAVGREAIIARASRNLGKDSLLAALAEDVRDLRQSMNTHRVRPSKAATPEPSPRAVKSLIPRAIRAEVWLYAEHLGFDAKMWSKFLWDELPQDSLDQATKWDSSDWKAYFDEQRPLIEEFFAQKRAPKSQTDETTLEGPAGKVVSKKISDEVIEKVRGALPLQPWPIGIHKVIAKQVSEPAKNVQSAIRYLIDAGIYQEQRGGELLESLNGSKGSG